MATEKIKRLAMLLTLCLLTLLLASCEALSPNTQEICRFNFDWSDFKLNEVNIINKKALIKYYCTCVHASADAAKCMAEYT